MSASASHVDIEIRGARPGEVDYLLNVIRLDAVRGMSKFPGRTVQRLEEGHLNAQNPVTILVALAGQVRVGYVFYTLESHFLDERTKPGVSYACAEVMQLFVLRVWQGLRIGQRLLNAALQHIDASSIRLVKVSAFADAVPLYEKAAFRTQSVDNKGRRVMVRRA